MNFRFVSAVLALCLAGSGCNTHKKTKPVAVADEPAVQLDTLVVTAPQEEVKETIYRESNPRSSDILHTKLDLSFDWKLSRMNGKATLKIKPYFYDTDKLFLDARGMDILSLEVFEVAKVTETKKSGDRKAPKPEEVWHRLTTSSYIYENDSLKISLGRIFSKDDYYYVTIGYVAKPNELKKKGGSSAITEDKGLYFINPLGDNPFKMPQIWTQGETQASSVWFPTIDSPNERMTQEIFITVEDKYTTLSNGSLVSSSVQPGGMRTDHWKLDQPHAPYLAMMAVGEFVKVTDKDWNGREISYYVEKLYEPHAKAIFGDTREMIEFYSNILGVPYAWPKYAQIVARDYVSGAMENTSATLHGDFMVYQTTRDTLDHKNGEAVIAHELFHQWFGDLVTTESWSNLPLNESFATYGEYLWEEYKHGRDAADFHHWQSRQGYMQSKQEVDLIRFDYTDKEDMFDAFSYNKGGQVLHMLRKAVGDKAFFAALKLYLEDNQFKPVEIHHLRLAFEEVTGRDMNWFFNQWFLRSGRPKLKVTKNYNASDSTLSLQVEQLQDLKTTPLYRLPMEVDLYLNGKVERKHIEISGKKQSFGFKTGAEPQLVNFDAERQLLADLEYDKSRQEYLFQYRNAPLFGDRMEALKAVGDSIQVKEVFDLFNEAITGDKYDRIRNFAMHKIVKAPVSLSGGLKNLLIRVYRSDKSTLNRADALALLNTRFMNDGDVSALVIEAANEQSYRIIAEALTALSKKDPQMALQRAETFQNEGSTEIIFALGAIYAEHGGDAQIPFFHNSVRYITGFNMLTFCSMYSKTAKRCRSAASMVAAAADLEMIGRGANRYTKFAATKGVKDILAAVESRQTATREKIESLKREGKPAEEAEKDLSEMTEARERVAELYSRAQKG